MYYFFCSVIRCMEKWCKIKLHEDRRHLSVVSTWACCWPHVSSSPGPCWSWWGSGSWRWSCPSRRSCQRSCCSDGSCQPGWPSRTSLSSSWWLKGWNSSKFWPRKASWMSCQSCTLVEVYWQEQAPLEHWLSSCWSTWELCIGKAVPLEALEDLLAWGVQEVCR